MMKHVRILTIRLAVVTPLLAILFAFVLSGGTALAQGNNALSGIQAHPLSAVAPDAVSVVHQQNRTRSNSSTAIPYASGGGCHTQYGFYADVTACISVGGPLCFCVVPYSFVSYHMHGTSVNSCTVSVYDYGQWDGGGDCTSAARSGASHVMYTGFSLFDDGGSWRNYTYVDIYTHNGLLTEEAFSPTLYT